LSQFFDHITEPHAIFSRQTTEFNFNQGKRLNPLNDHILVQRIKLGDRGAAEQLVDAHYERVYAILYSLCKNRETAEDLTQDTFIKVWQSIFRFIGLSRVSTWLYRIAYNTFVDWQRKQQSLSDFDELVHESCESVHFDDVTEKLIQHVNTLPEIQREVIILHYQHDLTFGEIANILDIPKGTVKSRLNAALENLRQSKIVKELRV
jgi:RNA polymerase sigma-70 factor, ECF subfamily